MSNCEQWALPITTELLRTAIPVYRCARCFRRHDDHRGPMLNCPELVGSTYAVIPYESHAREVA